MNSKRSALGAVAFNSRLYVCGGYDGQTSLDSVEEYNPKVCLWFFSLLWGVPHHVATKQPREVGSNQFPNYKQIFAVECHQLHFAP